MQNGGKSFPPPALPGFNGTTGPPPPRTAQPHPRGLPVGEHDPPPSGFPVLHRCPYACMPSPLPRRNRWLHTPPSSPTMAAFPDIRTGRLPHSIFRGLLSVHSHYGLHARRVTKMTRYIVGFDALVTSFIATIATGWSDLCRVGLTPTERPCLRTAHRMRHCRLEQFRSYQMNHRGCGRVSELEEQ